MDPTVLAWALAQPAGTRAAVLAAAFTGGTSFDFRAAFNATATRMMTAVLRNQQAGTEYA